MSILAVLIAFLALVHNPVHAQTSILDQCKRPGWIFLHKVQQKSWQAIMHCTEKREPRTACDSPENPDCIGFTSNGGSGNGWMYRWEGGVSDWAQAIMTAPSLHTRLPRLKECGPLNDPNSLSWEFEWSWVPMNCKDSGPCCGTYLANSAGVDAAFTATCESSAGLGSRSGSAVGGFNCEEKCPTIHTTHQYASIKIWEVECKQRRQEVGLGSRHRALMGSNQGGEFPAKVVKRPNTLAARRRAYILDAETRACSAVSQFCGRFS